MSRETETERTEFGNEKTGGQSDDPPPQKQPQDDDPDHRFRDWALI